MKRIIEGVTYNTDTATLVAQSTIEDDGVRTECALYQNRAGVYFGVDTVTTPYKDKGGNWNERTAYDWTPVGDAAAARKYAEQYSMTILRDIEDMPPEATPGEKMATIYLRVTPTLKADLDEVSSEEKISGNLWATRCLERCLGMMRLGDGLGNLFEINQIASNFTIDDAFGASRDKCMEAISDIADLSASLAKYLCGGEENMVNAEVSWGSSFSAQSVRDRFGPGALEASAPNQG